MRKICKLEFLLLAGIVAVLPTEGRDPLYDGGPIPLPGRIEFENFASHNGTINTAEATRYEAGAGEILIGASAGTTLRYNVDVAEDGEYNVKLRSGLVGIGAPRITVMIGSQVIRQFFLPGTGSLSMLETFLIARRVSLEAGIQVVSVTLAGTNTQQAALNYIDFELQPSSNPPQYQFVVSPSGDDSGPGTSTDPYRTLRRAFERIAETNRAVPDHGPIEILLDEGYHEVTNQINLDGSHSGSATGPVTLKPLRQNTNVIVGAGRNVQASQFSLVQDQATLDRLHPKARGRVYRAILDDDDWHSRFPGKGVYGMLSFKGVALQVAKFPNKGFSNAINENDSNNSFQSYFPLDGAALAAEFQRTGDMRLEGHWQHQEFWDRDFVRDVESDGRIFFETYDDLRPTGRGKFWISNVLAELDIPGEFYYDRESSELFLYPPMALSLVRDGEIRAGGNFRRVIEGSNLNFWTIRDITFQDSTGDGTFSGPWEFMSLRGDNIVIGGCTFRNSRSRVALRVNGFGNRVTGNNFYDLDSAFVVGGSSLQEFPLLPSRTEVTNNHLYKLYNRGYGSSGLSGVGVRLAHNVYHDMQAGVSYTNVNGGLLELNEWYDVGWEEGDWNVAYVGHTYANWGTVIRNNFVHNHIKPPGVRRTGAFRGDDSTAGLNFVGNILYKAGQYGFAASRIGTTITNNIGVEIEDFALIPTSNGLIGRPVVTPADVMEEDDRQQAITAQDRFEKANLIYNAEQVYRRDDFWETDYWAYKYPVASRAFSSNPFGFDEFEVRRNLVADINRKLTGGGHGDDVLGKISNSEDPITIDKHTSFRNLDTLDLGLRSDFQRPHGFYNIPFHKIGLFRDEFRPVTPHKHTYRAGAKLKWEKENSASRGRRANPDTDNDKYPDPEFIRRSLYDLGSYTSPLWPHYDLLTSSTSGTYGWTDTTGMTEFYEKGAGANILNSDGISGMSSRTFQQYVENGSWYAMVTFGDPRAARDRMTLTAEGGTRVTDINMGKAKFKNFFVGAIVTDGKFKVTIGDDGGNNRIWAITRIVIQHAPFHGQAPV